MTPAEFLRSLDRAATPGPWKNDGFLVGTQPTPPHVVIPHERGGSWIVTMRTKGDGELIATLRNLLPEIAAVVEAAGTFIAFEKDIRRFAESPEQVADECKSAYRAFTESYDRLTSLIAREQSR